MTFFGPRNAGWGLPASESFSFRTWKEVQIKALHSWCMMLKYQREAKDLLRGWLHVRKVYTDLWETVFTPLFNSHMLKMMLCCTHLSKEGRNTWLGVLSATYESPSWHHKGMISINCQLARMKRSDFTPSWGIQGHACNMRSSKELRCHSLLVNLRNVVVRFITCGGEGWGLEERKEALKGLCAVARISMIASHVFH